MDILTIIIEIILLLMLSNTGYRVGQGAKSAKAIQERIGRLVEIGEMNQKHLERDRRTERVGEREYLD